MRSWMIAFCLGVMLASLIPAVPEGNLPLLLLIPALLSLRLRALFLTGAYCLGLLWLLIWAQDASRSLLPTALERQDFWVRGVVSSLPEPGPRNIRFEFRVLASCAGSELAACEFSTALLHNELIQLSLYQQARLVPGQYWQFRVRLKRPHAYQNPGGFDYEAWLWQRGIRASGYVREDTSNQLLQEAGSNVDTFRQQVRERINHLGANGALQQPALIRALSIGDRQGLEKTDWDLFRSTGTTHLVVISGMHLGLLTGSLFLLLRSLLVWVPGLCLRLPVTQLAAIICLPLAWFYAQLAGFALPVQRAFIMSAVFLLSLCFSRHRSTYDAYCLALILVLLRNPLAVLSSGFWLSFAAVGLLLFFLQGHTDTQTTQSPWQERLGKLLLSQVWIFIGLLPLMLLLFQQSSLLAPMVNLFAIPFITLLVVPLCLLALLLLPIFAPGFDLLCLMIDHLLSFFITCLAFLTGLFPQALLQLPALSDWQWGTVLAVTLLSLFACRAGKHRLCLLLLLALIPAYRGPDFTLPPGHFRLDILDVGQGTAIVIRTRKHVLLYDLGPGYSPEFNAGESIILPFLRAANIRKVDRVIISHGDQDHAGGLPAVLAAYPQADYLSSATEVLGNTGRAALCRSHQQWHWDGVDFRMLHPDKRFYSDNNASCVLQISNGRFSVLLPGDIDSRTEQFVLRQWPQLHADILLAPHHGSRTSSHPQFVETLHPAYVIFSSGYLNQFNHPHPQVVKLYTNSGTIGLNTAETGAISWDLPPHGNLPGPVLFRQQQRRFWRPWQ